MAPASTISNGTLFDQAGLRYRPAAGRFHSQNSWLDSWHSFSFASHFDPEWCGFGPLRVINDDRLQAGNGFGRHPHADMEIITVMLEGELHHQDSMGHSEALRAGEVQRMTAGTGIVHSEINPSAQPCHLLQIWIEPSAPGLPPSYEQKPFEITNGWTLLIDPEGRDGAMAIHRPVRLWRTRVDTTMELASPLAPDASGWIQMIAGDLEVEISGTSTRSGGTNDLSAEPSPGSAAAGLAAGVLRQGDGLGFDPAKLSSLRSGQEGCDLLLFELR